LFCDMRGFTSFAETAEPEDVMAVLGEYHGALGPLIHHYEGTLDRFAGDGLIVFFNDPVPCPDPALRAVRLAVEMRGAVALLAPSWAARGHEIGFGVGVAQGYATIGRIGFADRFDYSAIGTVTNLAARLCDEARDGQILVTRRIAARACIGSDMKLRASSENDTAIVRRRPKRSKSAAASGPIRPKSRMLIPIASEIIFGVQPNSFSSGKINIVGVLRTPAAAISSRNAVAATIAYAGWKRGFIGARFRGCGSTSRERCRRGCRCSCAR